MLKFRHLKLLIRTVDDAVRAKELEAAGVDAITTNRPGWLRRELAKMKERPEAASP
jgi:glycerophosphoryl diester phosphodiesterase